MCDSTKMKIFSGGAGDAPTPVRLGVLVGRRRRKGASLLKAVMVGLLGLAAAACSSVSSKTVVQARAAWATAAPAGEPVIEWWRDFGDTNLTRLVEESLVNNRDLAAMRARVGAVEERSRIVGAELLPTIDAQLSGARQQQVFVGLPIPGAPGPLKTRSSTRSFNLFANWELDLWGRVRTGRKAALADYLAATDDLRGARLSLAAQMVRAWMRLTETAGQLEVARALAESHAVETRQLRARYESGLRPSVSLRTSESAEATAQATVKLREAEWSDARRQLEVLLGRYPAGEAIGGGGLPDLPPEVPAGLPGGLLERRPDLLAARWRLEAAGLRVKESKAGLLPRVSLTASGGRSSDELQDLLNHDFSVWSVAVNAAQPLFQGGRLRANVRLNRARWDEAVAAYDAAALAAFREVETALQNEALLAAREDEIATARNQADAVARLAEERYRVGLDEWTAALAARRRALEARSMWLTIRRARLDNRVALHLALGGGFGENGKVEDR